MEYKDILVYIDNAQQCEARVDFAVNLARSHQARLTGLYIVPPFLPGPRQKSEEFKAKEAGSRFIQKTGSAGVVSDWFCIESFKVTEILRLFSFYKDVVIVGQTDPAHGDKETPSDLPERLILGAGRPVVVVPYAGEFKSPVNHVLVAWRGGRESARAVYDALPFLKKVGRVTVIEVNPQVVDDDQLKRDCRVDICSYLGRHGVEVVKEQLTTKDIPVGDTLLNWACDQGVDLMVLGSISSNYLGGPSLGPVSRHILDYMTIPALISH